MAYTPTKWENEPSTKTPINADNLNKLEQGVKQIHDMAVSGEFNGKDGVDGKDGKDGKAEITPESVDYGLSVKDGKLNLGRQDEYWRIIDTPTGNEALLIGRISDDGSVNGITKTAGYLMLKEGEANVGIISDKASSVEFEGEEPLADGKCKAQMTGFRCSISAKEEIFMGIGDGLIRPAIMVPLDNKPRAYIDADGYNSDVSGSEYFIVNKKYLQSELAKLISRIEALEAK